MNVEGKRCEERWMDCVNDTKSKKGVKTEMMSDRGGRQETT